MQKELEEIERTANSVINIRAEILQGYRNQSRMKSIKSWFTKEESASLTTIKMQNLSNSSKFIAGTYKKQIPRYLRPLGVFNFFMTIFFADIYPTPWNLVKTSMNKPFNVIFNNVFKFVITTVFYPLTFLSIFDPSKKLLGKLTSSFDIYQEAMLEPESDAASILKKKVLLNKSIQDVNQQISETDANNHLPHSPERFFSAITRGFKSLFVNSEMIAFAKFLNLDMQFALYRITNRQMPVGTYDNIVSILENAGDSLYVLTIMTALRNVDGVMQSKLLMHFKLQYPNLYHQVLSELLHDLTKTVERIHSNEATVQEKEDFINIKSFAFLEDLGLEVHFRNIQSKLWIDKNNVAEAIKIKMQMLVLIKQSLKEKYEPNNILFNHYLNTCKQYLSDQNYADVMAALATFPSYENKLLLNELKIAVYEFEYDMQEIPDSLDGIIMKINSSTEFAKLRFGNNRNVNWLHYIVRYASAEQLKQQAYMQAIATVINEGVSPYERDQNGYTAFYYDQDKALDPYAHTAKSKFIGLEKQSKYISRFLTQVHDKSDTKQQFLMLYGPPGVGKTELLRKECTENGYVLKELERSGDNDIYRGGLEGRVEKAFDKAISSGVPTIIFIDEFDTVCNEGRDSGHDQGTKIAHIIQTKMGTAQAFNSPVGVVGATNFPDKILRSMRSRAGTPIRFTPVNLAARKKILEERLKYLPLDGALIDILAKLTTGWPPRNLGFFARELKAWLDEGQTAQQIIKSISTYVSGLNKLDASRHDSINVLSPTIDSGENDFAAMPEHVKNNLDNLALDERTTDQIIVFTGVSKALSKDILKKIHLHSESIVIQVKRLNSAFGSGMLAESIAKSIKDARQKYDRVVIYIDSVDDITPTFMNELLKECGGNEDPFLAKLLLIGVTPKTTLPEALLDEELDIAEVKCAKDKTPLDLFEEHKKTMGQKLLGFKQEMDMHLNKRSAGNDEQPRLVRRNSESSLVKKSALSSLLKMVL